VVVRFLVMRTCGAWADIPEGFFAWAWLALHVENDETDLRLGLLMAY
jgi:hypothetical protein